MSLVRLCFQLHTPQAICKAGSFCQTSCPLLGLTRTPGRPAWRSFPTCEPIPMGPWRPETLPGGRVPQPAPGPAMRRAKRNEWTRFAFCWGGLPSQPLRMEPDVRGILVWTILPCELEGGGTPFRVTRFGWLGKPAQNMGGGSASDSFVNRYGPMRNAKLAGAKRQMPALNSARYCRGTNELREPLMDCRWFSCNKGGGLFCCCILPSSAPVQTADHSSATPGFKR